MHQDEPPTGGWLWPVAFFTLIFFLNFMSRIMMAPLLPALEQDLGINHAQSGSLFLFTTTGYCITLLLSGVVSARLDHRRNVILCTLTMGGAMLWVGFCDSLWSLRLALLTLGLGAGLYLPSGMASITQLAGPGRWGRAIGVHEMAPNLGFVVAPLLAEFLMLWFSWRGVAIAMGCATLAVGLSFARFGKGGRFKAKSPSFSVLKTVLKNPTLWMLAGIMSLALASSQGMFSLLPLYLVSAHGHERETANLITSISRISGLFSAVTAGWAFDRLGPRRTLAIVMASSGILTISMGLLSGYWLIVAVFLHPVLVAGFFPPLFAALSRLGSPEVRNLSVAFASATAVLLGGGVLPSLISLAGERGSFGLGIATAGGMILAGLLMVPWLRLRTTDLD